MRTPYDISVSPITNFEWWNAHVSYSKFRRQGIDIVCASFKQKNAKANVVFVTGLMESFIKYSETIQYLYEHGFNVFTYDHQSQGLSGRCKLPCFAEFQSHHSIHIQYVTNVIRSYLQGFRSHSLFGSTVSKITSTTSCTL